MNRSKYSIIVYVAVASLLNELNHANLNSKKLALRENFLLELKFTDTGYLIRLGTDTGMLLSCHVRVSE